MDDFALENVETWKWNDSFGIHLNIFYMVGILSDFYSVYIRLGKHLSVQLAGIHLT